VEEKIMQCDLNSIERIMLNLLSNAVKFTPKEGSIFVNVKDLGNFIRICVKDTGIGIPKNKLDMIFQRFKQVDNLLTRQCEGSGIGLSLVKSLVELHNGRILVNSEYGNGSEFIVELPTNLESDEEIIGGLNSFIEDKNAMQKINVEFSDIYY
jgi:signal transduction histidine kinase